MIMAYETPVQMRKYLDRNARFSVAGQTVRRIPGKCLKTQIQTQIQI